MSASRRRRESQNIETNNRFYQRSPLRFAKPKAKAPERFTFQAVDMESMEFIQKLEEGSVPRAVRR